MPRVDGGRLKWLEDLLRKEYKTVWVIINVILKNDTQHKSTRKLKTLYFLTSPRKEGGTIYCYIKTILCRNQPTYHLRRRHL